MSAPTHHDFQNASFFVQCSPVTFDHAAWLSAVHSEVISVDDDAHSLTISPMTDLLRGQFDKLGVDVFGA